MSFDQPTALPGAVGGSGDDEISFSPRESDDQRLPGGESNIVRAQIRAEGMSTLAGQNTAPRRGRIEKAPLMQGEIDPKIFSQSTSTPPREMTVPKHGEFFTHEGRQYEFVNMLNSKRAWVWVVRNRASANEILLFKSNNEESWHHREVDVYDRIHEAGNCSVRHYIGNGQTESRRYILLPLFDQDLAQWARQRSSEDPEAKKQAVVTMMKKLVRAYNQLHHANRVVHCDCKPMNLCVESGEPRIIDFANSVLFGPTEESKPIVGSGAEFTADYRPSRDKEITFKLDVYSLGVTIRKLCSFSKVALPKEHLRTLSRMTFAENSERISSDVLQKELEEYKFTCCTNM